ncbi:MAG: hypothetical protein JXO22_03475, partial [Phycisphaerae bacterium]|nr:hypothetical protein [Phycisphaerae bacterium]
MKRAVAGLGASGSRHPRKLLGANLPDINELIPFELSLELSLNYPVIPFERSPSQQDTKSAVGRSRRL